MPNLKIVQRVWQHNLVKYYDTDTLNDFIGKEGKQINYGDLYETMSMTCGSLSFAELHKPYLKTTYVNYDEYKEMNKSDKLCYFESYIKNNKILSFIDSNKINIISVIGVIATFIFGFISILQK